MTEVNTFCWMACNAIDLSIDNWWQAAAWMMPLVGVAEANVLVQEALQWFTQWSQIKKTTFHLRGKHFTTELLPPIH